MKNYLTVIETSISFSFRDSIQKDPLCTDKISKQTYTIWQYCFRYNDLADLFLDSPNWAYKLPTLH